MSKKVAVVCANGRVGKLVVKEAVERGLDVTAFVKGKTIPRTPTDDETSCAYFDLCGLLSGRVLPSCAL